jgi:hypothetical protein
MQHIVHPVDCPITDRWVNEVGAHELNGGKNAIQTLLLSRAQVIHDTDSMALLHKPLHQMGPDETGASGNEKVLTHRQFVPNNPLNGMME